MEQTEYLQFLLSNIKNNIELPIQQIINTNFNKLKPFHKEMLLTHAFENSSVYYEKIFSQYSSLDIQKSSLILLKNSKTTLNFFEHFFSKNPNFFISEQSEAITDFPIEYFPVLFSRTLFSPKKMALSIFKLFQNHEDNKDKILFIMENQKKNFLPYHPDMYYLMLFFAYMKKNAKAKRLRYDKETKTLYYKPFVITDEFISTSKIIYDNFDNIFDVIKPHMVKDTYKGKTFGNTIINEEDFGFFIDFVSAYLHKEKIESKFSHIPKKDKVKKI